MLSRWTVVVFPDVSFIKTGDSFSPLFFKPVLCSGLTLYNNKLSFFPTKQIVKVLCKRFVQLFKSFWNEI